MAYKKVCKICGAEFETLDYRVAICSDDCRDVARRMRRDRKNSKSHDRREQIRHERMMQQRAEAVRESAARLSADARAARESGLSYGQWRLRA